MCDKGHYAAVRDQLRPIPSEVKFQHECAALGEAERLQLLSPPSQLISSFQASVRHHKHNLPLH